MAARIAVLSAPGITGFSLSRAIAQLEEIDGVDKAVLRALADHYPNIFPSIGTLVVESGWCERAVREALGRLIRTGLIRPSGNRRGGRAKSEQYIIDTAKITELQREKPGTSCPLSDEGNPARGAVNPARGAVNPARGAPEEISKRKRKDISSAKTALERTALDSQTLDGRKSESTSDPSRHQESPEIESVRRVAAYYVEKLGILPQLFSLTPARLKMGVTRFREALAMTRGDTEKAERLLKLAVDMLASSRFHRGDNPDGKKHDSWETIFRSQEKLEWWLRQSE